MAKHRETPWKNGYYFNKNYTPVVLKVDGENCVVHQIVSFDFPEMDSPIHGIWTFGDFGPACKEVEIASGKI